MSPTKVTYLLEAAMENNIAFLELYAMNGGNLNVKDSSNKTALHHSCSNDHREFAKVLIELGCNIESCDKQGETPLFAAVKNERKQMIEMLFDYNCNINHQKYTIN